MSRFFIVRPIATIVFMLLIVLFGYLNLEKLPIREYPNVEVPTISISTTYTGASSNIIETKITQPIENVVAGIEGLDNIQSISKEGKSNIQLEFSISRDLDAAANDVRDRINRILNKLPDGADMPIVQKYDSSGTPIMIISITNPNMSKIELSDYVDRYITDRFSVLEGVASVDLIGQYEQSMRLWLNRKEMAARGVTVDDVENALNTENVEYPAGRVESKEKEFPITLRRQYNTPEDFKYIVVSSDENGNLIRISDIARVSIEPKTQRSLFEANGESAISLGISKQSTANSIAISRGARELIANMQEKLPAGMKLQILRDEAEFIEQSIVEVFETIIIAAILVFLIVFIFIGSLKAALIPTITVPISIIGACIILNSLNYSINMLTLLAMVLAIGIVVDDAILVLENVQRRIDDGESPMIAAINGSNQVLFAVISTTVVLLATFLPIGMLPGKTGKLFLEFSVTISAAVGFSSVVALTLTPMLCSRFLATQKRGRFYIFVDNAMRKARIVYADFLELILNSTSPMIISFLVILWATIWIAYYIPGEYEPLEDRNMLMLKVDASEGTGYYAMSKYMHSVLKNVYSLQDQKLAASVLSAIPGFRGGDGNVNSGIVTIELQKQEQRQKSVIQIANELRMALGKVPGVKTSPIFPMGIGTKGSHALQFILGGYEYDELVKWRDIIFEEVKKYPGIYDIDCDYKETTPKFIVEIDKDRAGDLGVSAKTIGSTLEVMFGSRNVTTFMDRGREYDVILQADLESRDNVNDISNIYVKSQSSSALIPLDNIIGIREVGEAGKLGRQNRSRSITISGNISSGYTLGEALDFLERVVREKLPTYAQVYYRGQSKDYKESAGGVVFIFLLAMLISYFVLAAQFESFSSPLTVMLTTPLGAFGAIIGMWLAGYTMNIYSQIGLIMLIGLSAKHGILIVEFANQLRQDGLNFEKALVKAAKLRLRPIIMTGISTVAGSMPLLLAVGAGSASRRNLGVVQVFGGISGILLTLMIVPVGYLLLRPKLTPRGKSTNGDCQTQYELMQEKK
ncbi:MAG: efflux RND transporter permease subunit [Holosporaceae bacterium]|jgi:multidrug efflux pump|nr:efflux RND transporter permease subunit [Holosporaceae bacterium]